MTSSYLPVDPYFLEVIAREKAKSDYIVVHYFDLQNEWKDIKGRMHSLITVNRFEEFLLMEDGQKIRIDRIIVLNGRPGPAYDEYDSFALACLDCRLAFEE
ncbi:MAG: hypothetical protein ACK5M7_07860 [Draconibacterium sp.]